MRSTCPAIPLSIQHELESLSISAQSGRYPQSITNHHVQNATTTKQQQQQRVQSKDAIIARNRNHNHHQQQQSMHQQQHLQHRRHSNNHCPNPAMNTNTNRSSKSTMNHPYMHQPIQQQQPSLHPQHKSIPRPNMTATMKPNMLYYHTLASTTYPRPRPVPQCQPPPIPQHVAPYHSQQQQTMEELKKYRIENESFRLWSFYKPSSKKLLGRGGYGVVMEAKDARNGKEVAIKKMKNVFAHLNTAKCSLRELTLMMHFDHPNIINVTDCMIPEAKNVSTYQAVYYVMPKMQSTLKTVCCYSDIDISVNHRCFILYQILSGVLYIHLNDVIHRDLKPENILINSDCSIKITDFGMARGVLHDEEEEVALSEYVTTRWYRAPEIMLCSRQYKFSVDVWSIACIYGEMILRKPIFAGNNHLEQLELIFDVVGTPLFEESKQWIKSYDALRWVLSLPIKPRKSLHGILACKDINKNEIDLLSRMFILNPHKRSTVKQSLQHRFFKKIPNKIKSVKEIEEFKNVEKFDKDQTFEQQLTKLSSCREVMLDTLKRLHFKTSP